MHRCCVLGCSTKSGDKISFYSFPSDEYSSLKKQWISAVGRINWEPALSSRVCSKHFKEEDFYKLKIAKRLKLVAVPSINVGLCDTLRLAKMTSKECVVPTCTSKFSEAPYFHFPKDKSLCLKWLLAIPKGGWSLNQDSLVCSRHFEKADVVMCDVNAWLKTGSVPKMYLESPTVLSKDTAPPLLLEKILIEKTEVQLDSSTGRFSTVKVAPGPSKVPEASIPSTSQDVDLVEEGSGIYKIKLDADDGSESDLEIIEPEIETYEVSDTSDEGEPPPPPPKPAPSTKGPLLTSLKLQVDEIRSSLQKSIVPAKPGISTNGRVIRGDSKIKCCVPRCGSIAGSPVGVGFHSFPEVGETRLSVRSLDNKLTVHDLFSMWKSLLSVPVITKDSYVCTRHFTANDYTGKVLNKVAVPTQFLPTPVKFAPCKVQDKVHVPPPPLILLNKSKNPPPILRKPVKTPYTTYSTPPIRFPGIPSITNFRSLTRVTGNRIEPPKKPLQVVKEKKVIEIQPKVKVIAPKPPVPLVRPPPPFPKKPKLGCSIIDCPNRRHDENNKAVLYRLPHNIEKCKEWVYSCGHPEWLDKGMVVARSVFRICSLHFANEMFLDEDHKILKGSAKPTVGVQEPYKKCIVNHCHNYYDKDRLHYIGVDFATFPTETSLFMSWIKAVKNNTGVSSKSIKAIDDEDIKNFTGAVICSLHFRNSDYVAGPNGKSLSLKAVPTMNLVYVKEAEVPSPTADVAKETDAPEHTAPSSEITDSRGVGGQDMQRARRRPYQGKKRRRGRRPGWMKSTPFANANKGDEQKETNAGEVPEKEGSLGDTSLSLPEAVVDDSVTEVGPKAVEEPLPPTPARRGRPGRKPRGGGRSAAKLPIQGDGDEELQEQVTNEEQSSVRRSSRIGTLYGPSGRPLRSAVLKRKSFVESGSETQGSDEEEPMPRKRGRPKKLNSDDESSDVSIRRSLRPRRAASTKKFVMDDTESEDDNKDDDWQDEYGSNEPINYGGGVAESGHFLDPVLGVEPHLEESPENESAQPAVQESIELNANSQQKEDVTMASDIEERQCEVIEESTDIASNSVADVADKEDIVSEQNETDGVEGTLDDIPVTSHIRDAEKEIDTNDVDSTQEDIPVPCDVVKEGDTKAVEEEPATKGETVRNEVPLSENLETEDISDAPQDVSGEQSTQELVESQVPQPNKADEIMQESEDSIKTPLEHKENVIPFGPKLPIPTRADMEFFRSILPAMASFSHLQKTELRATVIATLKEMLNEDLDVEVMMSPETVDSVKNNSQMPLAETVEST